MGIIFYSFLHLYIFDKLKIKLKPGLKQRDGSTAKHPRGFLSKPGRAGTVGIWENQPRPSPERTKYQGVMVEPIHSFSFSSLLLRFHKCLFNDLTSWSHSTWQTFLIPLGENIN